MNPFYAVITETRGIVVRRIMPNDFFGTTSVFLYWRKKLKGVKMTPLRVLWLRLRLGYGLVSGRGLVLGVGLRLFQELVYGERCYWN